MDPLNSDVRHKTEKRQKFLDFGKDGTIETAGLSGITKADEARVATDH
jgi:hypothetical protein